MNHGYGLHIEARTIAGARFAWARVVGRTPLNVLNGEVMAALLEDFTALHARCDGGGTAPGTENGFRGVVLAGAADRAFIGGADLRELATLDPASARRFITAVHAVCAAIRALPVPVVARVRGHCLGAGMEVAAACDFRVGDGSAVVGMPEVRVGVPSVVEAALLPLLIGWGRTRELLLLGHTLDADAAAGIGFLERLVAADDLDAELERCCAQLAAAGPRAVVLQKALIGRWESLPPAAAIEAGIDAFAQAFESDEPNRLAAAFFTGRASVGKP